MDRSSDLKSTLPGLEPSSTSRPIKKKEAGSSKATFSLSSKLLLGATLLTLVPLAVASFASTNNAVNNSRQSLLAQQTASLESIRNSKRDQVQREYGLMAQQAIDVASRQSTLAAFKAFRNGFAVYGKALSGGDMATRRGEVQAAYNTAFLNEFRKRNAGKSIDTSQLFGALSNTTLALQYAYNANNPNPLGEKLKLDRSNDGSSYDAAHAKYHTDFRSFITGYGFYDLFLVDAQGNIVYTVFKENDFGTNLNTGPYAKTEIGEVYRKSLKFDSVQFSDAQPYSPSYNTSAQFLATPIKNEKGQREATLVLQVPIQRIDNLMTSDKQWSSFGLGKSGETYLVGPDKKLRSNSRFFLEDRNNYLAAIGQKGVSKSEQDLIVAQGTAAGYQPVNTSGATGSLAGQSKIDTYPDYRGVSVLGAYAPVKIGDQTWGILAEIDESEVLQPVNTLQSTLTTNAGLVSLVSLIAALAAAFWFVRSITRPIQSVMRVVQKVGQGDLSEYAPVQSNDEIGLLANAVNDSINNIRETNRRNQEELENSRQLQNNIGDFLNVTMDIAQGDLTKKGKVTEDVLGNVVDAINLMTEEIGYVLKDVQGVTQSVSSNANIMSSTTDAVLQGSQTQATEAAQAQADTQAMTNAIRKMAQRAQDSSSAAQQTLTASQQGQDAVNNTLSGMQSIRREVSSISKGIKGLSDRSLEISEIVETLGGIAAQTNLLALNAAIEASGAGEAGSRFAIVADEVRKLADDSAKAAGRVGGLIKNVQTEIQELVASIEGGTKEVEQGYRIAQQAGERLREIADLANQSSALAQAISSAAQQQVQGVERVANAVQSIASTATRTQEESTKSRHSAEQLRSLASQLSGTLERFRLPA